MVDYICVYIVLSYCYVTVQQRLALNPKKDDVAEYTVFQ